MITKFPASQVPSAKESSVCMFPLMCLSIHLCDFSLLQITGLVVTTPLLFSQLWPKLPQINQ